MCGKRVKKELYELCQRSIKTKSEKAQNQVQKIYWSNLNDDEEDHTAYGIDFLSNGFKVRNAETDTNTSGSLSIYLAFAEAPFKYATAR